MDTLKEFPVWLRLVEIPDGAYAMAYLLDEDHPYSLRNQLGAGWTCLALVSTGTTVQCWGYFNGDLQDLAKPSQGRRGVAPTPTLLKGTEE
jgi:hypothetical protein